jgi:hypothetical protein
MSGGALRCPCCLFRQAPARDRSFACRLCGFVARDSDDIALFDVARLCARLLDGQRAAGAAAAVPAADR